MTIHVKIQVPQIRNMFLTEDISLSRSSSFEERQDFVCQRIQSIYQQMGIQISGIPREWVIFKTLSSTGDATTQINYRVFQNATLKHHPFLDPSVTYNHEDEREKALQNAFME